jgi:hypothetical protein
MEAKIETPSVFEDLDDLWREGCVKDAMLWRDTGATQDPRGRHFVWGNCTTYAKKGAGKVDKMFPEAPVVAGPV